MTLIELMLALTLFSTILASVAGLVRSGLQARVRWEESVAPYQAMERALDRLAADLESAQPFFGMPFFGARARLEFARVDAASGEWMRVVYHIDPDAGGAVLMREEFLWRESGAGGEPWRRETVLPLIAGQFSYGMLDEQQHLSWQPAWDGDVHGLPRLIAIDCTLPVKGSRPSIALSRVVRNPAGNLPQLESP